MLRLGGLLFAAHTGYAAVRHGASGAHWMALGLAALIFLTGHWVAKRQRHDIHFTQALLALLCVAALTVRGWRAPAEATETVVSLLLTPLVCALLLWESLATLALVVLACAVGAALLLHGGPDHTTQALRMAGLPWLGAAWWWPIWGVTSAVALYRVWRSGVLREAAQLQGEGDFRQLVHALVEGALVRHHTEDDVLRAASTLLRDHGLGTFFMPLDGDGIRMGPHSFPERRTGAVLRRLFGDLETARWPLLPYFRQLFVDRRGRERPDMRAEMASVLGSAALRTIVRVVPQAAFDIPLFVEGQPYGLLVLRTRRLSASRTALVELFAKHVEAAVENVRHLERARAHVAEREKLEAELLAKERLAALGEMAGVVAHEVRNPLGVLSNGLALLARHPGSPAAAEVLGYMRTETQRLDHLVQDLLLLARPLTPHPASLELERVLGRVVQTATHAPALAGRTLELAVEPGLGPLVADGTLLEMALLNLVLNAAQASPEGRPVVLGARDAGGRLRLHVDDEGPGVPEALRERIFEPFFTTRAAGTGLGLSIVRRVVLAHGGTLHVEDRPGGGTRMAFELPLAPPLEATA
ncbi:MAG: ATP-binding protein [Myxococcaceae bacterium]|nr:ATP-binding protein [Myxococcaceae bacterium]